MAKLVASETAEAVFSGALQALGGYGYLEESSASPRWAATCVSA